MSTLLAMARPAHANDTPDAAQTSDGATASALESSDTVFVHVDARAGTALRTRASGTDGWTEACVAPCDSFLPRTAHYQVVMPGKRPSRPFDLVRSGEHIELSVSPNRLGLALGLPLLALGAFTTYGGVKLLASASDSPYCRENAICQVFGLTVLVGGVVEVIAGAVLPFVDMGTTVSQSTSNPRSEARRPPARSATSNEPARDAYLRAPTWSASNADAPTLRAPILPLTLSSTF